jgi:hypothetical protein
MIFESILTPGNFTNKGKSPHIYITAFRDKLPNDVVGGSTRSEVAPRRIRLEFGTLVTDTDVPTDKETQQPRTFFRDRFFVRKFFERTGAEPGDTVLFEQISPYHLRLSLRKADGRILAS